MKMNKTFLCYDIASAQAALRNFTESDEHEVEVEAWQGELFMAFYYYLPFHEKL